MSEDAFHIGGGQNSRMAQVKKWLAKVPRGASQLRLIASAEGGGTPVQLGAWPAEQVVPATTCEEIVGLLDEHCKELGQTIVAVLDWTAGDGAKVGGVKVLKRSPQHIASDTLASLPEELSGDSTSQAIQAQRHLEVMMRMQLQAMAGMFQLMRTTNDQLMERMQASRETEREWEERARRAERELEELREAVREVDASGDQASAETAAAQTRIVRLLEPVIGAAIAKYIAGSQPPTSPPPAS